MPAKIVTTKSNPAHGEINQNDYKRIIQDFENFVEIESKIARQIKKINVVTIPALLLKHLLDKAKIHDSDLGQTHINIKFGVTLPDQKDCQRPFKDVSNHSTSVLVIEQPTQSSKEPIELDEPGNFVIVPGFKEFIENGQKDGACCPVIKPGS